MTPRKFIPGYRLISFALQILVCYHNHCLKSLKRIPLSDREELRVEFRQWKNRRYAELRVWAGSNVEEAKWPTGKGFLVPVSLLPELSRAMRELEAETSKGLER
jgi:predicted DNA-binding antitoxin AbrB/MazE fold protein